MDLSKDFAQMQRIYLPLEELCQSPTLPAAIEVLGDSGHKYLCVPLLEKNQGLDRLRLHKGVSMLPSCEHRKALGLQLNRLKARRAHENVVLGRRFCAVRRAQSVEVCVVTSRPLQQHDLRPNLLKKLLSTLGAVMDSVYCDFSASQGARELDIQGVVIRRVIPEECGVDGDMAYKIHKHTVIKIESCVSNARLDSFMRCVDPMHGVTEQMGAVLKILRKKSGSRPRAALITGLSGSGKSAIIKYACFKEDYLLKVINCGELTDPIAEETEKAVDRAFSEASQFCSEGKTAILLKNLDVLCRSRDNQAKSRGTVHAQNVVCIRKCLDNLRENGSDLVVFATAKAAEYLDSSLKRPGRILEEVNMTIPSLSERGIIIEQLLPAHGLQMSAELLKEAAQRTPGYLGSDLCQMLNCMKKKARAENIEEVTEKIVEESLHFSTPSGLKSGLGYVDCKKVPWSAIGGLADVKVELQRAIEWPLKHPELFHKLNIRRPRGCLLYGPPGCGKTHLVRAAASSTGATFLSVTSSSIFSPYVGDSEKIIAQLFIKARNAAPTILFIDEIDGLVCSRDGKSNGVQEKVLAMLLTEMDGFSSKANLTVTPQSNPAEGDQCQMDRGDNHCENAGVVITRDALARDVFVIGATNRPDALDPALCRPGRLDQLIYVPPPDQDSREQIFRVCLAKMSVDKDCDPAVLAARTPGFSGADIENLCRKAGFEALSSRGFNIKSVSFKDFEQVLLNMKPSVSKELLNEYEKLK